MRFFPNVRLWSKELMSAFPLMTKADIDHFNRASLLSRRKTQTDFGCIFYTCTILSCAKPSPVPELTKCRFRPHRHSTADVGGVVCVFGLRTAVQSGPSACVWLAGRRMITKSNKQSHTEKPTL